MIGIVTTAVGADGQKTLLPRRIFGGTMQAGYAPFEEEVNQPNPSPEIRSVQKWGLYEWL